MPKRLSTPPILYAYCVYVYVHNGAQQQQQHPKKVESHIATTVPKNKQHCICFVPQLKSKRNEINLFFFYFKRARITLSMLAYFIDIILKIHPFAHLIIF